ncbi:SH3 domain-containing protein [Chitinophaga agrisoli]|uniref:SH3 domain-containing protein n=1 Tax=Chitinophaga agrisoli TaxID=2607653 RepID=A0A5B2W3T2_9BACT|nr:SH3 domain-containing protein [Chitinophaga agrisoli]KAA2244939.1 SH3 domain-containing protein [Chitinophaga agrisoli]
MSTVRHIILLLLLGCGALHAADLTPQQRFDKANNLYQQNQYSDAARIYQGLIDDGYTLENLYFNAGNAYYKSNRTGQAIYNYEKALLRNPDNRSVAHNLALANQRVQGFTDELPLLFFQKWWIQWEHLHSPNGWTTGSLVLFWLLIGGILAYLLVSRLNNGIMRIVISVVGVCFCLYLFMSVFTYTAAHSHETGIVMSSGIKAKAAPDQNGKDLFELNEGMKVQVLDATAEFCKVQLSDGKTGWVACDEVKRL